MTQVTIGRREVSYEKFVNAIKNATTLINACELLGFNSTVSTTRQLISDKAIELNLDTSHFRKYTKTEKVENSAKSRIKTFNIDQVNQEYYDSFEEKKNSEKANSFINYKPDVGAYLEFLGNRDFATLSVTKIENYVKENKEGSEATKKNCMVHIRSMMIHAVKNNVNGAVDKVSKNMLIWLIG
jgi:hypothetical protein